MCWCLGFRALCWPVRSRPSSWLYSGVIAGPLPPRVVCEGEDACDRPGSGDHGPAGGRDRRRGRRTGHTSSQPHHTPPCLQGEPGPPGQMGPEGPGGQQGSPGTQGRTIQGPVVGVAYPPAPTPLPLPSPSRPSPRPSPLTLPPIHLPRPGSTRGQRREGGPRTPRLAGSGSDHTRSTGAVCSGRRSGDRASPSGSDLGPAWLTASVLFQGHPGLQGTPGKVGVQGPKVGEEPGREGLEMEAVVGLPSRPHTHLPPYPAPARAWLVGGECQPTQTGDEWPLPGAGAGPGMDQPQPGTSTYPRQWWILGVTVGGAPASAPPTPSFALRE